MLILKIASWIFWNSIFDWPYGKQLKEQKNAALADNGCGVFCSEAHGHCTYTVITGARFGTMVKTMAFRVT